LVVPQVDDTGEFGAVFPIGAASRSAGMTMICAPRRRRRLQMGSCQAKCTYHPYQ